MLHSVWELMYLVLAFDLYKDPSQATSSKNVIFMQSPRERKQRNTLKNPLYSPTGALRLEMETYKKSAVSLPTIITRSQLLDIIITYRIV